MVKCKSISYFVTTPKRDSPQESARGGEGTKTLITRRSFVQRTALAAALYAWPHRAVARTHGLLYPDQQHDSPLDAEAIHKLASHIVGRVITPQASEYDAARSFFNLAFDRRQAVIVRCANPTDVARTLEFAQAKHLPLAVRAGGNSRLGFGMSDGGVVIDFSAMKRVEVDAIKRVARAEAGALVLASDSTSLTGDGAGSAARGDMVSC